MSADQNYPGNESPDGEKPVPNSAADDFFVKMNRQFRRPKPSEEAVAAALQAIQTLAGGVSTETNAQGEESVTVEGAQCPKCGGMNAESNRFCGYCGTLVERTQTSTAKPMASSATGPSPNTAGQHIYHHHYHHHYFPGTGPRPAQNAQIAVTESVSPAISATDTAGTELGLRQLVEDWISHANSKAFDQLAALYSADAILVRSDATLLSGRSSIRQYLEASSSSEVQLELTDTRLVGGVACLAGVNRILRGGLARGAQERGGKFLMVARQESGRWRILADIWCMNRDRLPAPDDSLPQVSESESAPAPTQMGRHRRSW